MNQRGLRSRNEVIHFLNLTFNLINMLFAQKVLREMKQMSTDELNAARPRLKSLYGFYWKITQEKDIDLTRPRGQSAQENCDYINSVGMALKTEIELRATTPQSNGGS
jgi:hypothetical protein